MKILIVRTKIKHMRVLIGCLIAAVCLGALVIITTAVISSASGAKPPQAQNTGGKSTVVIDPGHGGLDGGAVGYGGVVEKGINLSVSLKLRTFFEASGFNVVMTREDDRSIHDEDSDSVREKKTTDIHNRSKLLEKYPDAIFISIHQNKFPQSQYSGTQVFYSVNNENGKLLAQNIQQRVKSLLQPGNDRVIKPAGKNLYILYHAKSPAVMVECGFLSNPGEAAKLQDSGYQNQMAFAVFCGTLDYYKGIKK